MSRFLRTLAAGAAISLSSCGGGDGGQTDYVLNASPGGIWTGTVQDTLSPQQVIAGVAGGNGSAKYAIAYK